MRKSPLQAKINSLLSDLLQDSDPTLLVGLPRCTLCSHVIGANRKTPICKPCALAFKLKITDNELHVKYALTGTSEEVALRFDAVCKYHYNILSKMTRLLSDLPPSVLEASLRSQKRAYLRRIRRARYQYKRKGPFITARMDSVLAKWESMLSGNKDES